MTNITSYRQRQLRKGDGGFALQLEGGLPFHSENCTDSFFIYNFVLAKSWLTNGIQIRINKEYIGIKAKKNYT